MIRILLHVSSNPTHFLPLSYVKGKIWQQLGFKVLLCMQSPRPRRLYSICFSPQSAQFAAKNTVLLHGVVIYCEAVLLSRGPTFPRQVHHSAMFSRGRAFTRLRDIYRVQKLLLTKNCFSPQSAQFAGVKSTNLLFTTCRSKREETKYVRTLAENFEVSPW